MAPGLGRARSPRRSARGALIGQGNPTARWSDGLEPPVLALHGWSGTPLEVALVLDVAAELGLRRHAPLLPGHGTHARDLARTRFSDWSRAAAEALDRVAPRAEPAIVVGLSLGAVLALHLAATSPERVRALVLLASATRLSSPFPSWALRLADALHLPDFHLPKDGPDLADPAARRTHLTYSSQPVRSATEVLKAGDRIRPVLGHVRCPALIVHGEQDRVCPVANAHEIAARLGSSDKRVLVLPRSAHIVTRDYDHTVLRRELRSFISRFVEVERQAAAATAQTPVEP